MAGGLQLTVLSNNADSAAATLGRRTECSNRADALMSMLAKDLERCPNHCVGFLPVRHRYARVSSVLLG